MTRDTGLTKAVEVVVGLHGAAGKFGKRAAAARARTTIRRAGKATAGAKPGAGIPKVLVHPRIRWHAGEQAQGRHRATGSGAIYSCKNDILSSTWCLF